MAESKIPAAFLSHSTEDSEIARRLAVDLRSTGVDVWYAEWELKPGDSLRRKIDEGIGRASHFLVLLTPASLKSEWVQTELDAGMVKRIEGSCRLIPVLHGIEKNQVPPTLSGLIWVKLETYEVGLRQLIGVCHDVDIKPPLGSPPKWVTERPLEESGLSIHAQRLAALLNQKSEHGLTLDPVLNASEVLSALELKEDEVAIAADELDEIGWVKLHRHLGMGRIGFGRISPTERLFFNTDLPLKGWNTEDDARVLAATSLNTGKQQVSLHEIDQILAWGTRRINPAAKYLAVYGYVNASPAIGSHPYAYSWLLLTSKTRRFASGK